MHGKAGKKAQIRYFAWSSDPSSRSPSQDGSGLAPSQGSGDFPGSAFTIPPGGWKRGFSSLSAHSRWIWGQKELREKNEIKPKMRQEPKGGCGGILGSLPALGILCGVELIPQLIPRDCQGFPLSQSLPMLLIPGCHNPREGAGRRRGEGKRAGNSPPCPEFRSWEGEEK